MREKPQRSKPNSHGRSACFGDEPATPECRQHAVKELRRAGLLELPEAAEPDQLVAGRGQVKRPETVAAKPEVQDAAVDDLARRGEGDDLVVPEVASYVRVGPQAMQVCELIRGEGHQLQTLGRQRRGSGL